MSSRQVWEVSTQALHLNENKSLVGMESMDAVCYVNLNYVGSLQLQSGDNFLTLNRIGNQRPTITRWWGKCLLRWWWDAQVCREHTGGWFQSIAVMLSLQGCDNVILCHTLNLLIMTAFKSVLWYPAQQGKGWIHHLSYIYQICDKTSFLMGWTYFCKGNTLAHRCYS